MTFQNTKYCKFAVGKPTALTKIKLQVSEAKNPLFNVAFVVVMSHKNFGSN